MTENPRAAQEKLLRTILSRNRDTVYGRKHGFSGITGGDAFARRVPVTGFEGLAPYVERMKKGEERVLTADRPLLFCQTSGTTDRPKWIPVTRRGRDAAVRLSVQWFHRVLRDHPAAFDHTILYISGTAVEGLSASGIPYGSTSGMIREGLPVPLRRALTLPGMVSTIQDYGLRYAVMARLAFAREVSCAVTPNPATLIRIAETADCQQDGLIRSIREGGIDPAWFPGTGEGDLRVLNAIGAKLAPDRTRARFLESVVRRHGRLLPSACWRRLKVVGCWLGGSVGLQRESLARCFGESVPLRDIGYLASEGSMTIPSRDDAADGILALANNHVGFVPENENVTDPSAVLPCHEVEPGKRYAVILTNWNGLYRYDIGDVVEVRGFYNRAPLLAFVRKGDDFLNITGEKLHVNHVLKAVRMLREERGVTLKQVRIVPDYSELRYVLLVVPEPACSREQLRETVLPFMDRALCESNIEYRDKRHSKRLRPPCLHRMSGEWEDAVRRGAVAAGGRDAQYKWRVVAPALSATDAAHIRETIHMPEDPC